MKKFFAMIFVFVAALALVACKPTKTPDPEVFYKLTLPTGVASDQTDNTKIKKDTDVVLTVTVPEGKELVSFKVDDVEKKADLVDSKYTVKMTKDITVKVEFKDEADPVSEFVLDGEFTAFEHSIHRNGPMVTSVTVTIKNGEIEKFYIDALQGSATKEGEEFTAVAWNEKSKKELKFEYKMHWPAYTASLEGTEPTQEGYKAWLTENNELEWHEQAALIEAELLKVGVGNITVNDQNVIQGIAGVTIKDGGYLGLAEQAVANAKAGKVVVFQTGVARGAAEIYSAEVTFDKDVKATAIVIDTLQSKVDKTTGLVWNEKTKQGLQFEYKMHWPAYTASLGESAEATLEGYKTWLTENNELEWHEQVALIAADVIRTQKTDAPATPVAGVSVTTTTYYALLAEAFNQVK